MPIENDVDAFFLEERGRVMLSDGGHVGCQFDIVDDGKGLFFIAIHQVHLFYKLWKSLMMVVPVKLNGSDCHKEYCHEQNKQKVVDEAD